MGSPVADSSGSVTLPDGHSWGSTSPTALLYASLRDDPLDLNMTCSAVSLIPALHTPLDSNFDFLVAWLQGRLGVQFSWMLR